MSYRNLWGPLNEAAEAYDCTEEELAQWAIRGAVYAYHRRGEGGGWWFPLGAKVDVVKLRFMDDHREARAQAAG